MPRTRKRERRNRRPKTPGSSPKSAAPGELPRWKAMGNRACIFCGEPADSDEHLLSEWLQGVLPSDEPVLHYRQIGGDESERREWMKRPFREKAGVVCDDCNTGWMSRLESGAKPTSSPGRSGGRGWRSF